MAEDYLDPLQGIVRQTIREELSRLEPRFQRITMSQDTDGHPAELYGAGGKIYYRKEGGVGAELGTGDEGDARYVRKDAGAGTQNMRNDLHFINYQVLEFFDNAPTLHGDISIDVSDNFVVRSNNSSVLTLISAAGYIACSGDRLSDVGTPVASGDAVKVDANIHVPLAQLPLTSKGTVFAGNGTAAGVLAAGTNTHVLTLDSTAALGVKWAAGSAEGLWEIDGAETQLITADSIDMQGHNVLNLGNVQFGAADIATIEKDASSNLDIKTATGKNIAFKPSGGATTVLRVYGSSIAAYQNLNMGGTKTVEGLIAATANGQAVRYEQLANYYTQTAIDTWRNSVTQTEMGYVNGVTSDIQTQLAARLPLAGGTMVSEAGINMNMGYLSEIGSLKGGVGWDWTFWGSNAGGTGLNEMMRWDASEQDIKVASGVGINMTGGTIEDLYNIYMHEAGLYDYLYLKSQSGVFTLATFLTYTDTLGEIHLYGQLNMNSNDITKCKDIEGLATGTDGANRLALDFRGDAAHRIYYTGIADNKLQYKTFLSHEFVIQSTDVLDIKTTGIHMQAGKYIKSVSGDLEFQVPSGSSIKFTAV